MSIQGKQVASIELDCEDHARGAILIFSIGVPTMLTNPDSDPFDGDFDSPGFAVVVQTPDGMEHPALPVFTTEVAARQAIQDSWGRGPWDLQWDGEPMSVVDLGMTAKKAARVYNEPIAWHLYQDAFHGLK